MKKQILKELKRNKGITLIALVITIIVLIILAGVSISTLIGENGLITQANEARDNTQKANVIELVQTEILAAEAKTRSGDIDFATLKSILGNYFDTSNVTEEKLTANFTLNTKSEYGNQEIKFGDIYNGSLTKLNYSVPVNEDDIHPEIFDTNENEDGTVTIIGFKNEEDAKKYYDMPGVGINVNAIDKLIIPDKIDNSTVTGVKWQYEWNYKQLGDYAGYFCPNNVKEVIMPNTLLSYECMVISGGSLWYRDYYLKHNSLTNVVFSENLESVDLGEFDSEYMTSIKIPAGIKKISCNNNPLKNIKTINFQGTQEQWEKASSSTGNTWNGATVVTSK